MPTTKAANNRTISIDENERPKLASMLTSASELPSRVHDTDLLINADLMEVIDIIPDGIADLVIIDPPYNLTKDFNGATFNARSNKEYAEYLSTWFHKVRRKMKPNGSLYMCGDWRCTSMLQQAMEAELTVINRITWQREKGRGAKSNWKNSMEDIWFGVANHNDYYFNVDAVKQRRRVIAPYRVDGKPKDWEETDSGNFRLTHPSNFWDDISVPFWSMPENTDHPTQKPEKLYAKLILASSRPGDLILDPFMGSGTAAVVAKKLKRHYIGIEINEEYCLWAAKRITMATTDKTIQGYADGVFWERNSLPTQRHSPKQNNSPTLF